MARPRLSCKSCLYWKRIADTENGMCMVDPPTIIGENGEVRQMRPNTQSTDYCKKYVNAGEGW